MVNKTGEKEVWFGAKEAGSALELYWIAKQDL